MVDNIIRREDGVVEFPAELMELVEHVSYLVHSDPKVKTFIEENAGERDRFGWLTMILGLVISQNS